MAAPTASRESEGRWRILATERRIVILRWPQSVLPEILTPGSCSVTGAMPRYIHLPWPSPPLGGTCAAAPPTHSQDTKSNPVG